MQHRVRSFLQRALPAHAGPRGADALIPSRNKPRPGDAADGAAGRHVAQELSQFITS